MKGFHFRFDCNDGEFHFHLQGMALSLGDKINSTQKIALTKTVAAA